MCVQSLSRVLLSATRWTVGRQATLSMEFYRQEYWSGLSFSPPGDLSNPGVKPVSCVSCTGRQIIYHSRHLASPVPLILGNALSLSNSNLLGRKRKKTDKEKERERKQKCQVRMEQVFVGVAMSVGVITSTVSGTWHRALGEYRTVFTMVEDAPFKQCIY